MQAAFHGYKDIVELLLEKGKNIDVNIKDENGVTALSCAAWQGYTEGVRLLLKYGAKVSLYKIREIISDEIKQILNQAKKNKRIFRKE